MRGGRDQLLGQLLERRYRLDAPIARGGMSMVYRGLDVRLDRPVAVKVMDPKFAADPQFLARFEFEARAVARLKHPGLVAVYDQGVDGELAFLVMELVEGGTLRELLRERGPMPPHAARAVAEPVLDALGVAHAAGLVHRDIKPENVLISDSGEVKLADFGLVRAVAASNTTSSSVILGTAAYLSPEQVTSGTADARSDVYAMGVMLFEMLTGRVPFTGDNSLSVAYQRIDNEVPRPSELIDGVPEQFDDLVLAATEHDASRRFPNAGAMAAELRSAAVELELPPYRVPAPRRSAQHASAGFRAAPPDAPTTRAPTAARTAAATTVLAQPQAHPHAQPPAAPPHQTKVVTTVTPRPDTAPEHEPDRDPRHPRFPDLQNDRRRSRRTTIVWLLIVLALALLVGVGGWWLGSGRYTAIPPIDGLDRGGAVTAIENAGLSTKISGQHSDTVPVDAVLGTDPPVGSRIPKNSTVTVLVSLGRPAVPAFTPGDATDDVFERIRAAGLKPVDGGETYSRTAARGTVAALDPTPGTSVAVDAQVKVLRSKGAPPAPIPDLKGRTVADATAALADLGVTVRETRTRFDADVDEGNVIGTDPAAGSTLDGGDSVVLIVSNAVKVPGVVGSSVGSARSELEQLGLRVQVRQVAKTDNSVVITQNPGSGSRVEPGSKITIISLP
ncbi:Stk1 family PASTA domain-containing Ser/Thr kinase [Aldersonia sp. NBC_00410]|uniref:Stk1 family PASTA domain-containing Ser/Thr kinase n=1 Tax=Aldersonia sp. NBC_00410 TaxID=2975954 RepID=UPI002250584D|nr:Stk1 family PASTA domain-containing Ser/Thr kinase [Aldersonia sp. NBC_00410]MCX5045961.1 Stk1 family PASTA domain-containing Ser/Thr kinase [Aldersonia sp. NBC_00410]